MAKKERIRKRKKRQPEQPKDHNVLAKNIVDTATDSDENVGKNPAAVLLGRLGGLKGGPARARKLSAKKRKEIARKAALVRWHKETNE